MATKYETMNHKLSLNQSEVEEILRKQFDVPKGAKLQWSAAGSPLCFEWSTSETVDTVREKSA